MARVALLNRTCRLDRHGRECGPRIVGQLHKGNDEDVMIVIDASAWEWGSRVMTLVGLLTVLRSAWSYARNGVAWATGWSRRARLARRSKMISLLDELRGDAVARQSYIAGRLFDILATLGGALMLLLVAATGSDGAVVAAVFASIAGMVAYAMGLQQSVLMGSLRAYEKTRARLCDQVIRLGGQPPER